MRKKGRAAAVAAAPAVCVRTDSNGFVRCRVCGCTEVDPCNPPCGWAEGDLCTGCRDAAEAVVEWRLGARRANKAALLREVERRIGEP